MAIYGLLTLEGAFKRLSNRFKLKIILIMMQYPEAPVDVDNPHDEKLARELLAARRNSGCSAGGHLNARGAPDG